MTVKRNLWVTPWAECAISHGGIEGGSQRTPMLVCKKVSTAIAPVDMVQSVLKEIIVTMREREA